MLISPTESPEFRSLGTPTWKCEEYGVDAFWVAQRETWGVQRKALADFCASVDDGRLATERLQMTALDHPMLILETGERGGAMPRELPGGGLATNGGWGRPWTGAQIRGVLYGLMADGVQVMTARDEAGTIERVRELEEWSRKERHDAARGRGTVPRSVFGDRGAREYGIWLLRSLPGVGPTLAGAMWDHFGGLPIVLRNGVGIKDLMEVPGCGKITARRIMEVFGMEEN